MIMSYNLDSFRGVKGSVHRFMMGMPMTHKEMDKILGQFAKKDVSTTGLYDEVYGRLKKNISVGKPKVDVNPEYIVSATLRNELVNEEGMVLLVYRYVNMHRTTYPLIRLNQYYILYSPSIEKPSWLGRAVNYLTAFFK